MVQLRARDASHHGLGFLLLYVLMRFQHLLPLNPQGFAAVPPISLSIQRSVSSRIPIAVLRRRDDHEPSRADGGPHRAELPVCRNRDRACAGRHTCFRSQQRVYAWNFWADLTRATLYVLLRCRSSSPWFCTFRYAADLFWQRRSYDARRRKQVIALGPVASQEAIKQLGTNGGGFFNVNAAHPFENPNGGRTFSRSGRCS